MADLPNYRDGSMQMNEPMDHARPSMQQDWHPDHNMPTPEYNGTPAYEELKRGLSYNADPKNRIDSMNVSYVGAKSGEALKAGGFFRRNYDE